MFHKIFILIFPAFGIISHHERGRLSSIDIIFPVGDKKTRVYAVGSKKLGPRCVNFGFITM